MRKLLLLLCLFFYPLAGAADVQADLNRHSITLGDTVTLSLSIRDNAAQPDLQPLTTDFDVTQSGQQTQINIISGETRRTQTLLLQLKPKRAGKLLIPALAVGSEATPPLQLEVKPASSASDNKDFFIELRAEPEAPFVQAQTRVTVAVFVDHDIDVNDYELSDLKTSSGQALIKIIGKDHIGETYREGRRYDTLTRRYIIFPQTSGELVFAPVQFSAQVSLNSRSLLDPFGGGFTSRNLQSEPLTVAVKPPPAIYTGKIWLPAESLVYHETWSDDIAKLKAGTPLTWTISLLATGLTAAQLPDVQPVFTGAVKTYTEQAVLDDQKKPAGITGVKQQRITVIPQGDLLRIPEIRISWWNIRRAAAEEIVIPERQWRVTGAAASISNPAAAPSVTQAPQSPISAPVPASGSAVFFTRANILIALFASAWLLTTLMWWRERGACTARAHAAADRRQSAKLKEKAALRALLNACAQDDAPAARLALLQWADTRWQPQTFRSLGEIAAQEPALSAALNELNQHLYHRQNNIGSSGWRGTALAGAARALPPLAGKKLPLIKPATLQPLYRT